MSDYFNNSSSSFESEKPVASNSDLEDFLLMEKQKAQFTAQTHEFSAMCWDKCIDKPTSKLDGRTETCLVNCVNRFIDVSLLVTNRFTQMMQKS